MPILRILKCRHLEVIWQLEFGIWVALERLEVYQQAVLDREYCIVFDILAAAVEDLCDNGLVACSTELFDIVSLQ